MAGSAITGKVANRIVRMLNKTTPTMKSLRQAAASKSTIYRGAGLSFQQLALSRELAAPRLIDTKAHICDRIGRMGIGGDREPDAPVPGHLHKNVIEIEAVRLRIDLKQASKSSA
jgi:hypothetical protein